MKQQRGLSHAVFACILLVLWSSPLLSQQAPGGPTPGPDAAAADPDPELAAAAYKESLTRYAAGNLAGALESMRKSYQLSGRPALLYNLARLEAELNDCPAALANYRKYIEAVPQGQYRLEADNASQQLQTRCGDAQVSGGGQVPADAAVPAKGLQKSAADVVKPVAPASVARPPLTETSRRVASEPAPGYFTPTRWLGWSLIATSALAGAGALYARALAVEARSEFQDDVNREQAGGVRANHGLEDKQHRRERWAVALGVTGGALLGGGIAVLLLEPKGQAGLGPSRPTRPTAGQVTLRLEPGGLGASFLHTF